MSRKKLHDKTLQLELYSRRDNLRLEGIPEQRGEKCLDLICEILSDMGLDPSNIQIARSHRLGPYQPKRKTPWPIIFKLVNPADREMIWSKRVSLKGSRVWLSEDYPSEIDRKRQLLWPYVRAARLGNPDNPDSHTTAYLREDKIVINKKSYDQIESLPKYVLRNYENPPAMKKSEEITLFFTKKSPLSNFFPCHFNVDDIDYSSAEQYISYHKALLYDTTDVAAKILHINDPKQQKQLAKRLAKFDQNSWDEHAGPILKSGLKAKFDQNDELMSELLSTGDTILGEACSHDLLFGIGLSLHNPNAMNRSSWRGQNLQGVTLMEIRDEIRRLEPQTL